jgi:hypothetical protein
VHQSSNRILNGVAFLSGAVIGFAFLGISSALDFLEKGYDRAAKMFAIPPRRN